jgi:hypothetical protein
MLTATDGCVLLQSHMWGSHTRSHPLSRPATGLRRVRLRPNTSCTHEVAQHCLSTGPATISDAHTTHERSAHPTECRARHRWCQSAPACGAWSIPCTVRLAGVGCIVRSALRWPSALPSAPLAHTHTDTRAYVARSARCLCPAAPVPAHAHPPLLPFCSPVHTAQARSAAGLDGARGGQRVSRCGPGGHAGGAHVPAGRPRPCAHGRKGGPGEGPAAGAGEGQGACAASCSISGSGRG